MIGQSQRDAVLRKNAIKAGAQDMSLTHALPTVGRLRQCRGRIYKVILSDGLVRWVERAKDPN